MSSTLYVDIAFPTAVRRVFTYHTDDGGCAPGMRVWVPLRSEYAIGMIVRVHSQRPDFKTRAVARRLDEEPILTPATLSLCEWMHRFYYCSLGEVIQAALPVGLNFSSEKMLRIGQVQQRVRSREEEEILDAVQSEEMSLQSARKRWRNSSRNKLLTQLMNEGAVTVWEEPRQSVRYKQTKHWLCADGTDVDEICAAIRQESNPPKWKQAFLALQAYTLPAPQTALLEDEKITPYTLNRLEEEGWIEAKEIEVRRNSGTSLPYDPSAIKTLLPEQEVAFDAIRQTLDQKKYGSFLLYGVTGSGKTEVYIHALKLCLEQGRGGLVLVPEIALTPQTVARFFHIFGDQIAVLHSRLSDRERYEAWQDLQSGKKRIAIGPRSAVFAPVQQLGLIVVDEEHDASYKQFDPAPRYHARDVAIVRARKENAVIVLGSATPAMSTLLAAKEKKHHYLSLPGRPSGTMPEVRILDLKEYKSAMRGPLTVELHEQLTEALERGEQAILLYNRRGFASYLLCEACGHIPESPHSATTLTYHKKKNILLCHYSGYSRRADRVCEKCGSDELTVQGTGTQQLEEQVAALFPDARLLRMDRDTTSGKLAHEQLYDSFLKGDADILIGTQLVAKGLNFPNVTVVGVLNAETELAFPSFRAGERMFQLLSQVAGRAGRAEKPGRVFVQTWKPQHPSVLFAQTHNYTGFAKQEMQSRYELAYPPFSRFITFQFRHKREHLAREAAEAFTRAMKEAAGAERVMGPSPEVIPWMHGQHRWEAHLKAERSWSATQIEGLLDRIFELYETRKPQGAGGVRINVDVDAIE
ncbi:MAG: primosomal protein N' [Balneolaceae bacterium]